jgi:outer membrane protein assembly factor BamB
VQGATNFYSPSYSPRTGLFYLSTWQDYANIFQETPVEYKAGQRFGGGIVNSPFPNAPGVSRRGPVNVYTDAAGRGALIAIDPHTGQKKWSFDMFDVGTGGILTTASDLLFAGGREGYFQALDAYSGKLLWKVNLGGDINAGPVTYQVDGRQYVVIAAGNSLFAFALRK